MADGRRSDGHDAELLRSVFVILSGALAFIVGVVLFWELRRIVAPGRDRRLLRHHPQPHGRRPDPAEDAAGHGHLDRVPARGRGLRRAGLHLRPADLRRRPELRPRHPRVRGTGRRTAKAGSGELIKPLQHRREGGGERPEAPGRAAERRRPGGARRRSGWRRGCWPSSRSSFCRSSSCWRRPASSAPSSPCSHPSAPCRCAGSAPDVAGAVTGYMAGNLLISCHRRRGDLALPDHRRCPLRRRARAVGRLRRPAAAGGRHDRGDPDDRHRLPAFHRAPASPS